MELIGNINSLNKRIFQTINHCFEFHAWQSILKSYLPRIEFRLFLIFFLFQQKRNDFVYLDWKESADTWTRGSSPWKLVSNSEIFITKKGSRASVSCHVRSNPMIPPGQFPDNGVPSSLS